jgi:hypothetical protein
LDPFNKNKTQGVTDPATPAPLGDEPAVTEPVAPTTLEPTEPVATTTTEPDVAAPPAPPDETTVPSMGSTPTPVAGGDDSSTPVAGTQPEPVAPLGQTPTATPEPSEDEGTGGGGTPLGGQ